jgi:hypothetical protein
MEGEVPMAQATMSHRVRLLCAGVATTAVVLASIFLLSASSGESHALTGLSPVGATAGR